MQNCTESTPPLQLTFDISGVKKIDGSFDGGNLSSDGGLVLLKMADEKLGLSNRVAEILGDKRQNGKIKFSLQGLFQQMWFMIGTGYEDLNDADRLAGDPMHKLCAGRNPESDGDLASDSTLRRVGEGRTQKELDLLQELLVQVYIDSLPRTPDRIRIDMDGYCDEVHGQQQLSFYNGYYQTTCFIPLFAFAGKFPIAAILRPGNADQAGETIETLARILKILRKKYPKVKVDLVLDAGFKDPKIYEYCEKHRITYYIGLPSNSRLKGKSEYVIKVAERQYADLYPPSTAEPKEQKPSEETGGEKTEEAQKAPVVRVVQEIAYAAEEWTKKRRVLVRCDYDGKEADVKYVVTNQNGGRAKWIYEEKYCKRGDSENVIKEFRSISCDRLSYSDFNDNQFRLLMFVFAYILMNEVRNSAPPALRHIRLTTLQLRFLKIAVLVHETARKIYLKWCSSYPWQEAFSYTVARLRT